MQQALNSLPKPNLDHAIVLVNPVRLTDTEVARVTELVKSVIAKTSLDSTVEAVIQDIAQRHVQLWRIGDWDALAVTRYRDFPKRGVLCIEWLSGAGMSKWINDLVEALETFGRMMGCEKIEFTTPRKGWEFWRRRFPEYEPEYVVYRKDI